MPFLILLLCSLTFAGPKIYELKFDMTLEGKNVGSGKIMSELGKTSSILKKGSHTIEITLTEHPSKNPKAVMINFVIKDQEGKILSTPKIATSEGVKAKMAQASTDGKEFISVEVIANEVRP